MELPRTKVFRIRPLALASGARFFPFFRKLDRKFPEFRFCEK